MKETSKNHTNSSSCQDSDNVESDGSLSKENVATENDERIVANADNKDRNDKHDESFESEEDHDSEGEKKIQGSNKRNRTMFQNQQQEEEKEVSDNVNDEQDIDTENQTNEGNNDGEEGEHGGDDDDDDVIILSEAPPRRSKRLRSHYAAISEEKPPYAYRWDLKVDGDSGVMQLSTKGIGHFQFTNGGHPVVGEVLVKKTSSSVQNGVSKGNYYEFVYNSFHGVNSSVRKGGHTQSSDGNFEIQADQMKGTFKNFRNKEDLSFRATKSNLDFIPIAMPVEEEEDKEWSDT